MTVLNKDSAEAMVRMQHSLNCQINPEWVTAGFAWHRAAWLEAGELMEHLGWKWWKAQTLNIVQAQIEVIDILHFLLSDYIVHHGTAAATILAEEINDPEAKVVLYRGRLQRLDELDTKEVIDVFASQAATGVLSARVFDELRQRVKLNWSDVYRMYMAKNALNIFRQANGYKEGRYVKDWLGEEDNVFLEKILDANPSIDLHALSATLSERYSEVLRQGAAA